MAHLLYSPMPITIKGKSEDYAFMVYNIDDIVDPDVSGIYIFTITKTDTRNTPIDSHIFLSFSSVKFNNQEAIKIAKENGALFFCYRSSSAEYERQAIIKDIQEGSDYQYQLEAFPELTGD